MGVDPVVGSFKGGAAGKDVFAQLAGEGIDPALQKPPTLLSRLLYVLHAKSTMFFVDGPPTHHRLSSRDESARRRAVRAAFFLAAVLGLFVWMIAEFQLDGYGVGISNGASVQLSSYEDAQAAGDLAGDGYDGKPASKASGGDSDGDGRTLCFCAAGAMNGKTVTDVSLLVDVQGHVFPNFYLPTQLIRTSKLCERRNGADVHWDANITYAAKDPTSNVIRSGPTSPTYDAARRFAVWMSEMPQTYQPFNAVLLTKKQWLEAMLSEITRNVELGKNWVLADYRSRPELLYELGRPELTRLDCTLDWMQAAFYCALRAAMGTPEEDNVIETWEDEGVGIMPCRKLGLAANVSIQTSDPNNPDEYISNVDDLYSAYTYAWCDTNSTACISVAPKTSYQRFVGLFNTAGGIYSAVTLICIIAWALVVDFTWILSG